MIATNKDVRETDKLFQKLIAPSLGSFRLDSHVHHYRASVKTGSVLLPQRSSTQGAQPLFNNTTHSAVTKSLRTPPATEITLDESLLRIGDGRTTASAVDFESYEASSGGNLRRQQHRTGSPMSSISCTASVPWTFYSTTKMKQLPLPQVQSSEVLRTLSPGPRGKRNVSVCSERYLGTSVVGRPHHRRSKSAADVLHPMSSTACSSEQVRRFEEERQALLQTRTLKKNTEVMAHRRDRKYHMSGSGVPIHDRYMVDSEEMEQLRQLIQARSTKRGSSPVSYYGRYGVRVTSGHGTRQTKSSPGTDEQKDEQQVAQDSLKLEAKAGGSLEREVDLIPDADPNEEESEDVSQGLRGDGDKNSEDTETKEIQNMMPNVRISKTLAKKTGKNAFMTDFETSDAAGDDIQDVFGNFKSDHLASSLGKDPEGTDVPRQGSFQDNPTQEKSQELHCLTAEEALLGMLVSDDKISAMEDNLRRLDRLKGGIQEVGHLEGSKLYLEELNPNQPDVDYGQEVFGRVLNDEELTEIETLRAQKRERLRAEKREAKGAKSRKADDSIMAEAKVSQAKSKMADIYNFISPAQQEVFEKKFQELDLDGNGVVTLQELFKRMYRGKAKRELGRVFMQVFDLNKDQTIDEREFVIVAALNDKLTGKLTASADAPLELDLDRLAQNITAYKEIFQVTDQDADGRLTLEDVMLVISLSGNPETGIDPEIVQHVHDTIDADDNGTIDFMEFLTYIPFFVKLHNRMAASRHITIAEVERAREAVRSAVLKARGSREVTMKTF